LKKILLGVTVLLAFLLGAYLTAVFVADSATRMAIDHVRAEGRRHGVRVLDFFYDETLFVLPATIYWRGVEITARVEKPSFLLRGRDLELKIEKASFQMDSFSERAFRLRMRDIRIDLPWSGEDVPGSGAGKELTLIKGKEATVRFRIESFTSEGISRMAAAAASDLHSFFLTGKSSVPITFSGTVSFPHDGNILHSRVMVERREGSSVLIMDEEDVVIISRRFNFQRPLTDAEIRLVSRNPLKALRLFQIRTYARGRSMDMRRSDGTVPDDAYRHVLWSFLLTKEFGGEFAERVTEAHELGKTGNTEEERLMDINNNRIGREYARTGKVEEELLKLTLTDPRVVRKPPPLLPPGSAGKGDPR